ncbi:MAG: glycogen debranching enzyme GlgX, partial [Hellea sp.]|nr:glycogen debranching enzyme GlgX [Hellea sp.]
MPQDKIISKGSPAPLGPDVQKDGVNFAIFSSQATSVTLCLFSPDGTTETDRIKLPQKSGDIWHGFVKGLKAGQL